ncbi:helix-turn-helix domain-containing protein [Parabacteroides goldsteinii]|uniref:helix-turn-helix domain-containing protein n=1 Tax=Parabacteroides goldsteinii TaxID=328812 RepID=UPI00242D0A03|nr:helix-turn-helix domain-containing protein [Parabacteroides goldsteinii]
MKADKPKELPKLDIPEDWVIGTDISREILNMYTNFPCRLKAGIFVLCLQGEIEASIDATNYTVKANDFVTIVPGSILQIHKVEGDLQIYFLGYSSQFITETHIIKSTLDIFYTIKATPVISLKEEVAQIFQEHLALLARTYLIFYGKINREITKHMLFTLVYGLGELYKDLRTQKTNPGKSEKIANNFTRLVMQHYSQERNVAFYAGKLGITQAHLSTTIRQVTGKTCLEIIASMVIMDAKAQLKSTDASVQNIAYSLNFSNMSFFGKYFKRHVGIGPLEYRNG